LHILYSLTLYLLTPFVILRLLWLGVRNPAYWHRWGERFGFVKANEDPRPIIWVHAVSVGEAHASKPIINYLLESCSQYQILITTTTPTGASSVIRDFGESVRHLYFPYDLPGTVRRYVTTLKPQLLLVMETELWPNLFQFCKSNDIPVLLVNARMSEKSANGYAKLKQLTSKTLGNLTKIAAQTQDDAKRLIRLGAEACDVIVTGNLKFDIKLPHSLSEQAQSLRRSMSVNRAVVIAASTHEGEEELILDAFAEILQQHPDCLLIIAPRHPERFDSVFNMCKKRGYNTIRHSLNEACQTNTHIYMLDTLGELPLFYAASDIAFIGGSLVPKGGQNVLEPASLGLPILVGPYTFNFLDINRQLVEQGNAWVITNSKQFAARISELLTDANLRHQAGERGKQMVEKNRGSSKKVAIILDEILGNATSTQNRI